MTYRLILADARKLPIADKSVQCCVTSPPYWGLRNYGNDGQLGLEQTPEQYVANMVAVFSEVHRVLRDDGVLFLNLGDSYNSTPKGNLNGQDKSSLTSTRTQENCPPRTKPLIETLKIKNLVGIPWRVAFALQAAGWYLRQDIIWHKPNPMPESVTDRCTKAHEYLFLLAKSERYYFDAVAIAEESVYGSSGIESVERGGFDGKTNEPTGREAFRAITETRNKRSVWTVPTSPYKGAHFATYPPDLIDPCILAGTSAKGCCAKCGAPWERIVEKTRVATRPGTDTKITGDSLTDGNRDPERHVTQTVTKGWEPGCKCGAEVVPCTVLDPFNGAGTTGLVSVKHGRDYIGTDINPDYLKMADERIGSVAPLFVGAA